MKKLLIGTNLKMYKTPSETADFVAGLQRLTQDLDPEEVVLFVIPSFTAIPAAVSACRNDGLLIGAQNMHWAPEGQYTGEISARMLKDCGVSVIEIGHSERRHVFHETDGEIGLKVGTALDNGFIALLCIGETAEQKACGVTEEILRMQLKTGLQHVREAHLDRLWIAYEPVWAIGTSGLPAEPSYAEWAHSRIHQALEERFPQGGAGIPVLYGGSVNPDNAVPMISQPSINGLFVGRSAWQAEPFNALIRNVRRAWQAKSGTEKAAAAEPAEPAVPAVPASRAAADFSYAALEGDR